jgi:hypothetical protein
VFVLTNADLIAKLVDMIFDTKHENVSINSIETKTSDANDKD